MDETPEPKKAPREDGGWWAWFAALFTKTDPARTHDSGGEISGVMPHDGGHHDGGSGSGGDAGGDGGGGGGD